MRDYYPTLVAIVAVMLACVGSRSVTAQTEFFDHNEGERATRLWIPPDTDVVRGILIVGNGARSDATSAARNRVYQRFGELHDFAVIGTGLWGNFSDLGEIDLWEDHVEALSIASGHPELAHAPWAPIGFSNGGQMSYGFNSLRPDKVIAFIANKGCCYNDRSPSEAALKTPGLLIAGENDTRVRRDSIRGLFDDNRPRGALWAWVEQETFGHAGSADRIVLPFMSEAIRLRYPLGELPSATGGVNLKSLNEEEGWLANQSTWMSGLVEIASYPNYREERSTAGWLLNENMAQLYRAFATYDKPVSMDFPRSVRLGESLIDQSPLVIDVRIDTSSLADWAKVELFDYAQKVGEVMGGQDPMTTAIVTTTLSPGRVHALTALVTHADGATVSTTDIATVLTVPVPEPSSAILLLAFAVFGIFISWRRVQNVIREKKEDAAFL